MRPLPILIFVAALAAAGCGDSPRPYGARTTPPPSPPNTAAPTVPAVTPPATTPTPGADASPVPKTAGEDVDAKKGSETGMAGGASGTVASGGKPGSGTGSGGGTGPARSSGETQTNQTNAK